MVRKTEEMKDHVEVWPNVFGAKNWQPSSYNQKTGLVYANTLNFGWKYKAIKPEYKQGAWYLGVDIGGWVEPADGNRGYLSAIDPVTGKTKWEAPHQGSVLVRRRFHGWRSGIYRCANR